MKVHYLVYEFEEWKESNCGLIKENISTTSNWKKVTCLSCLDLKEKVKKRKVIINESLDYNGDSGSSFY